MRSKNYRIDQHPEVAADLTAVGKLIADYAGEIIADAKLDEIGETLDLLEQLPHIGTIRNEIYPGLRAIPTAEKGVIAFTVDDDARSVFIVAITYAGADWINIVKERQT